MSHFSEFKNLPEESSQYRIMPIFLFLLQSLPYVGPISGGLREGMAFYLQGVVHTNAAG